MATVVRMPALAAGATEAAIQTWLVAVGDAVAQGQPIVEIETEKAVVEYEAEQDGVLARILVDEGSSAQVGSPIAVLAAEGEDADAAIDVPADPPAPTESSEDGLPPAPAPVTAIEDDGAGAVTSDPSSPEPERRRLFASPLVRRLAAERGIELDEISGSGPNGRITRRDLDAHLAADAGERPSPPAAPPVPSPAPVATDGEVEVIPHTGMRRAIARRLTESKSTVPHFYLRADCRVDELLALRARVNEGRSARISVNDFVVKAVAGALVDVPEANAIWTDDAVHRFSHADIAIAVAVPAGLVTPVVRHADRMSLSELSGAIADLAERARAGRLKQHELEGGAFSVSNLGMYGTAEFAAIINPPQAGILAVGAATERPVAENGELAVRTVMTVTLSADHRVVDGAVAAQWLAAFVRRIENPLSMLV